MNKPKIEAELSELITGDKIPEGIDVAPVGKIDGVVYYRQEDVSIAYLKQLAKEYKPADILAALKKDK